MHAQDIFAKAAQSATSCIKHLRPEYLGNATPCSEWDLRALLNHMVYELLWVPEIIRGKTVVEVGDRFEGDVLRSDPKSAWQHAADAALVAVHSADEKSVAHLSYGDVPLISYIREIGGDQLIHTWDLAQAMQATLLFEEELSRAVYDDLYPRQAELARTGLYAPAIEPTAEATMQDKLLNLVGRRVDWQ